MTVDIKQSGTTVVGFPVTANLTANSAGCTPSMTSLVCTITLAIPPGAYTATLTTFAGLNGTGGQLSAAQAIPITVIDNRVNTIPLVLGGIPATVALTSLGVPLTGNSILGFTLASGSTGSLTANGVDAAGNTIVGVGTPTITVSSDSPNVVASTTAANVVTLAANGTNPIGHVTLTLTPDANSGAAAVSKTFTVQSPMAARLYVTTGSTVKAFDATGTQIALPGGFSGVYQASAMAYDPANSLIYIACQGATSTVLAFDRDGNAQPIATPISATDFYRGLVFDPVNSDLYVGFAAGTSFDTNGTAKTLAGTPSFGYSSTFDPLDNRIVSGTTAYNPDGSVFGSLPFTGQVNAMTFNPFNGLFYVATVYPTAVTAYTTAGVAQSLSGTFINGSSEQIGGMVADPATGNVYIATNFNKTYGYDKNGNALSAPWTSITTIGSGSGAAGIAIVPAP